MRPTLSTGGGILERSEILSLWSRRVNTRVCPILANTKLEFEAGNHTSVSLLVVQRCPASPLFSPSLTGPQWQSPSASDQPVELRPVNLSRYTVTFSSAITLTSLQALSSDLSPQPFSYENVPCYVKRQAREANRPPSLDLLSSGPTVLRPSDSSVPGHPVCA